MACELQISTCTLIFSYFSNKQDCLPNEVEENKKFQTSMVISIVILGTASVIFFSFYVKLRNTKA